MAGFPWGGSECLWSEAARHALESGHKVAALTYEWDPVPEPINRLIAVGMTHWVDPRPASSGMARRVAQGLRRCVWRQKTAPLPEIWRRVLEWRPDFVCVSQGSAYDGALCPDIFRFLIESAVAYGVICQHNSEQILLSDEEKRTKVAEYYRSSPWVAFVADGNRRKAERELGIRVANAIVIKNPVNLRDKSRVLWPCDGPARLACVARLDATAKGQDLLFEVLASNRWQSRDWRLRLYGGGPDNEYLKRVRNMFGLTEQIEFAGHVADIRRIWADNHLLILPSRSEGTPLSLIEAMLCARPALVTDVGGNAEWISEPTTGFIADAPSTRSLDAALERAWETRDRWPTMGEKAHEQACHQIDQAPGESLVYLIVHGTK